MHDSCDFGTYATGLVQRRMVQSSQSLPCSCVRKTWDWTIIHSVVEGASVLGVVAFLNSFGLRSRAGVSRLLPGQILS